MVLKDILNKVLETNEPKSENNDLDISNLANEVYFIQLPNGIQIL